MKSGERKIYVYIPFLGLIETADTLEETLNRIRQVEIQKEKEYKKTLKKFQQETDISATWNGWLIRKTPLD
ncbi:hypothetical protein HPT25_16945 [Bacillus sp. BRMEA1]|uniref:hypothetical protein n=1 Tax=Neobacillus endophyticus TaxID=2738405 RepID=UPI00156315B2|nr:hypothetical protein [Neobacillus endophyticus]NRD79047.1 hypothetical protein [Neobacillus endophyticus]